MFGVVAIVAGLGYLLARVPTQQGALRLALTQGLELLENAGIDPTSDFVIKIEPLFELVVDVEPDEHHVLGPGTRDAMLQSAARLAMEFARDGDVIRATTDGYSVVRDDEEVAAYTVVPVRA